jgi:hypothetical protein
MGKLVGPAIALGVLVTGACRDNSDAGSRTIDVLAFAGKLPEPGVTVVSHTVDGDVIEQVIADAVGHAQVGVDDDSLVSVVFPGAISEITPIVSVVTTAAPADGIELSVYGPSRSGPPPLVVGALELDGPNLSGAKYFDVDVGCATVRVTQLPEFIDIGACSMGSDQELDVLVRAYHDVGGDPPAPVFDGYAAGRARMADGHAVFDLPAWQTTGAPITLALSDVQPILSWTLYADGVPFGEGQLAPSPFAYANLAVDRTQITAVLPAIGAARYTDLFTTGVPQQIALSETDFLAGLDLSTEIASTSPLAMRWDAASSGVDAINLHVTWQPAHAGVVPLSHRVIWDAVLPPDATSASLPRLDGDLGATLAGADALNQVDVLLRHIDSAELADFAALQAAGIHAEETIQASTIVPRPAAGNVRVAHVIGVR